MIPEKEREALMRLTMCAREECGMCKYTYTCNFDFQYELATKNMNILADALRKTENSSEKPNNSDTISRQAAIDARCNACGKIDCDKMDKCEKLQKNPEDFCSDGIPKNIYEGD